MKVFTPERALYYMRTTDLDTKLSSYLAIPDIGDWKPTDDYFVQVTSGGDINDVIHAKVVDHRGIDYTVMDYQVIVGGKAYPAPSTVRYNKVYLGKSVKQLWHQCCTYIAVERSGYRRPKNYKGNKDILEPYTWFERIPFPFALNVQLTSRGNRLAAYVTICMCVAQYKGTSTKRPHEEISLGIVGSADGSIKSVWQPPAHGVGPSGYAANLNSVAAACSWIVADYSKSSVEGQELMLSTVMEAAQSVVRADLIEALYNDTYSSVYSPNYTYCKCVNSTVPTVGDLRQAFLLDEDYVVGEHIDPVLLGKDLAFHGYWRNYLCQHALLAACESFPRLSDNSIQNILEIVSIIKALVIDRKIEFPKSWQDAWLAYRYSYNTAKMDIQDAVKFFSRRANLGTLDREIRCYGVSHHNIEGVDVTCRCSIDIEPKNLKTLDRIIRALDQYGLTPDFYVIWDSIPYSFMVDWFLPMGDILSVLDANTVYFSGEYYSLSNICYSLSYTRDFANEKVKCYTRWKGSIPTSLNSLYWLEGPSANNKTVAYRVLDTLAMFIGGG